MVHLVQLGDETLAIQLTATNQPIRRRGSSPIPGIDAWVGCLVGVSRKDTNMSTESIEQLIEAEVTKRLKEREPPPTQPGERVLAVGRKVFIRTVTHHYTGRITLIEPDAVVLENAAWIAC